MCVFEALIRSEQLASVVCIHAVVGGVSFCGMRALVLSAITHAPTELRWKQGRCKCVCQIISFD